MNRQPLTGQNFFRARVTNYEFDLDKTVYI